MAQLSTLSQLFVKIAYDLSEEDVRNLRAILVQDNILGRAKVEDATPVEIFNMLRDNKAISEGNLGLLVQILRSFQKGRLADEVERLQKVQKKGTAEQSPSVENMTSQIASLNTSTQREESRSTQITRIGRIQSAPARAKMRSMGTIQSKGTTQSTAITQSKGKSQPTATTQPTGTTQSKGKSQPTATNQSTGTTQSTATTQSTGTTQLTGTTQSTAITQSKGKNQPTAIIQSNGTNQSAANTSSRALSGQVSDAKANYELALAVAMETGNKIEQMDIYCKLGDLHREQLDEPQVSHKYYTDMLALAKNLGRKNRERLAYNRLGLVCRDMQDYEAALEWQQKELKMSQDDGDKEAQMTAHINVGNTYRLLGKTDDATSHFNTALQIAQHTGDQYGQMMVYYWIGDMHREQLHSPQISIQYYEQHLALARQLMCRHEEGVAYNRVGLAHDDKGEYETALEWFQKYLKMSQDDGDKKNQTIAHTEMGNTYRNLNKLREATSHFNTALQMAQQRRDVHGQMDVYFWMGEMHRVQLHSPQTSTQYYEQHRALARQLMDRHQEGVAYNRLGLAHHDMGENEAALEWFQKYLKMSQKSGDKTSQITAHQCIAVCYNALGQSDQARSHYKSAMAIAMETGNKQQQEDIAKRLADL